MNCQVKLLRAVEHRQILPIGSTEPIDVDLRLIAATNKNLAEEIKASRFREDLYFRLNVVEMGKQCVGVSDDVMRLFMHHEWKGNIREMQNVIERAVIFAEEDVIRACDIGLIGSGLAALSEENENLQAATKAYEKEQILRILNRYEWNKAEAAKALGVGLSSLYRKIDELGINVEKHRSKKGQG
jgi:transcriptional regulator with PAS, ATPase and Fis domain